MVSISVEFLIQIINCFLVSLNCLYSLAVFPYYLEFIFRHFTNILLFGIYYGDVLCSIGGVMFP